jgi:gas vesicle protein
MKWIHHQEETAAQVGSFLMGCLTGLVIGCALGVLLAPHRGEVTRRKLRRRVEEARDQVSEKMEDLQG